MKASDSANSLTELNPPEPSCFICLETGIVQNEPLVDSRLLRNCGCKFSVHPACWNQWMKGKSDYDCPICRKDSMLRIKIPPNPVMLLEVPQETRPMITWPCVVASILCLTGTAVLIVSIVVWG